MGTMRPVFQAGDPFLLVPAYPLSDYVTGSLPLTCRRGDTSTSEVRLYHLSPCLFWVHGVGFLVGKIHFRCSSFPNLHIFLGGAPAFFNHFSTNLFAW